LSSEVQEIKTTKESLEEYEKGYLERMKEEKKEPDGLQNLIFSMSQEFKKLEKKEYIGFCSFCNMGVERVEMAYKKNLLFHSNCYDQQGNNFPAVDQEILLQTSNAKVQLVLLKNLRVRTMGTSNPDSTKPKTKTRKKSKGKTKKRQPKRRVTKRKRTATKRRTSKRKPSKKRRVTKRRASRTTKRKARRRR
jgi:hypothetical protein